MPDNESRADETPRASKAKLFDLRPDTEPVILSGEDANIGDAIDTFNGLERARKAARRPENERLVNSLEETFQDEGQGLKEALAGVVLADLMEEVRDYLKDTLSGDDSKVLDDVDEETAEALQASRLLSIEGEEVSFTDEAQRRSEEWQDGSLPEPLLDVAEAFLDGQDWDGWAEWGAPHVIYWNRRELVEQIEDEGGNHERMSDEEWHRRFNERLESEMERHVSDLTEIMVVRMSEVLLESIHNATSDGTISLPQLDGLLGLDEDEENEAPAPLDAAPSPEREGNLPTITAPPVSEGLTAIRRGRSGWPERDSQGNPRFVFERDRPYEVKGQFNVIVPKDNRAFQAAEAEMAQKVLRSFGHRTARLMLACSAHAAHPDDEQDKPTPIPGKRIREWLGVDRQTRGDLPRHKRDQICFDEIERLSRVGVQINVLSNIREDGWADYDRLRRLQPVWHLNIHEHGQVRVMDGETRAENWQLLVEPSAWGKLYVYNDTGRQFGYFSRALLENIDWHRNPEGGDLAIELLKFNRFQRGRPKDLTVGRMLEICQLNGADSPTKRHRKRKKLEQAILEQERWGWDVDWTRWPDAYRPDNDGRPSFPRGYWKGRTKDGWECPFHNWKVTFYPPEDMGALNSRAEKIDNSDPHELEPKGWPDRIEAILDATNYSQAGVARELEVSQASVSFWKSGEQTPSPEHQAKLRDIERRHGVRGD